MAGSQHSTRAPYCCHRGKDLLALGRRHRKLLRLYWTDPYTEDETVMNELLAVDRWIVRIRARILPELVVRLRRLLWRVLKDAERLARGR